MKIITIFETMKEIKTNNGHIVMVDDDWYNCLNIFNWYFDEYVKCNITVNGKRTTISIHNLIAGTSNDYQVIDHINGNKLDNRVVNLRICTYSENAMNRKKRRDKTTSKYKGVHWYKQRGKWKSAIRKDGKLTYIGIFELEKDAAHAYNEKAKQIFGKFALLNKI